MTVKRIFEIQRLIGLSTDVKPTDSVIGTEFLEYDTKNVYIVYNKVAGIAQWVLKE